MTLKDFLAEVVAEEVASLDAVINLDDGTAIRSIEVGWDEDAQRCVVWLFPETRKDGA